MAQFEPHDLDFAFDADQLHPPHPFAELIRLAFAHEIKARPPTLTSINAYASYVTAGFPPEALYSEWHRTIMCFADRYGLWLPLELSEDESSNAM